ncbi:MAG: hypothetical protein R3234_00470 [Thermoanaerobaculia bacterium]|nr:hypothetical protein [Thermoanaerobaculia bacterium]
MIGRRHQSGQGKLGCVLWTLVFLVAILAAVKMIPVRVRVAELTDYAEEQAKWARGQSADKIRERLHNKARQLDLPIEKKNIHVEKGRGKMRVRMQFTVPIDFPGYTYQWDFDFDEEWDIFIF